MTSTKGLDGTAFPLPTYYLNEKHCSKLTVARLVCVLRGDAKVAGTVTFEQESESAPTTITWDIAGNDPNAERGFHIHTFGDNTNGCTSAGPHFNPHGKTHGAPSDEARHVGDLGNIKTDAQGNAKGSVQDSHVKLIGPHSVVGVCHLFRSLEEDEERKIRNHLLTDLQRTVVVHAGTDDLGKGGNEESLKTGNAGPRPACGMSHLTYMHLSCILISSQVSLASPTKSTK